MFQLAIGSRKEPSWGDPADSPWLLHLRRSMHPPASLSKLPSIQLKVVHWKSLHNYHGLPWVIPLCHNILNNTLSPSPRYLICVALDSWYVQTTPSLHVTAQRPSAIKNDRLWSSCGNGSLLGRGFLYSNNCSRSCVIRCPEWYCQKSKPSHQGHPNTC